ncbi:MAG: MFS transporter [Armatimonadota bacterium]|nr:MFS transporter [Armatimonadota bacterium]
MPQHLPPAFAAPGFARLWLTTLFTWWSWFLVSLTQGWLMLQITDSPAWVGLAVGVRGLSLTVFSVAGGAIADRVDRRRLLVAATGFGLTLMLATAALIAGGGLRPWHLLALMGLMGVLAAVERPTSAGLMYDLVGPERLLNASAVRLMGFSIVQALSGLVGGFVLARWSATNNLLLAAAGYAGAVFCAAGLRRPSQAMHAVESFVDTVAAGLRYTVRTRPIRLLLLLSLIVEGFGFAYIAMFPVMARDVLDVGGFGLGLLTAAAGAGTLVATTAMALRPRAPRAIRLMLAAALAFGTCIALFGFSRWFTFAVGVVVLAQASGTLYDVTMYAVLVRTASDAMRGRVLGFFSSTTGFSHLGGVLIGVVAVPLGAPAAITISGALTAAGATVLGLRLRTLEPRQEEHAAPKKA